MNLHYVSPNHYAFLRNSFMRLTDNTINVHITCEFCVRFIAFPKALCLQNCPDLNSVRYFKNNIKGIKDLRKKKIHSDKGRKIIIKK